jgi:D-alanyl-D-alanine carboxypeptidase
MINESAAVRLRELIHGIADDWAVPGGVVAITDRDAVIFEHAFGFADREREVPATAGHLFEIGSISKIFTATVVLQLVEEGMLRLEQPVGEILDWLPPSLAGQELTIERLLQHTAGLVSGVDAVQDQAAQVASFTGGVSTADPGTFFHYSNLGFILLGLAVQRLTGAPLGRLEQERILDPLGMRDSTPTVTNSDYGVLARGYRALHDDRFWLPGDEQVVAAWLEVDGADGAIAATASDLAAFARMLLGDEGPALKAMTTHLAPDGEDTVLMAGIAPVGESRYGLGVNVETTDGRVVLSHGGGMVGYASFLLADLVDGLGVVVLTNSNGVGPIAEVIARAVAATAVAGSTVPSLDPERWAEAGAAPQSRPRPIDDRMLGRFVSPWPDAVILVRAEADGRLVIEAGGVGGALLWTWGGSIGTRHPAFRPFPLTFDGESWLWGDRRYRPEGEASAPKGPSVWEPYLGHYRTYSPWFSNFRIVDRDGVLLMLSTPAVESPGDEVELAELSPGVFRIGADPRLPERLTFGPHVDGRSAWADRDGCRYSRSFLD